MFHVKHTPFLRHLLIYVWVNDLHDPVQILNRSELNAHPALATPQLNLYIGI